MTAWTRELDLALVRMLRQYWREDRWTAGCGRFIDWGKLFDQAVAMWPEGWTRATLKERWQENYRKWVRVGDPTKRADEVDFIALEKFIQLRDYGKRIGGKRCYAKTCEDDLASRSKRSCLPGEGDLSLIEAQLSLYIDRRFTDAFLVTLWTGATLPVSALASVLNVADVAFRAPLSATQFTLLARALCQMTSAPHVRLTDAALPWAAFGNLLVAVGDERIVVSARRDASSPFSVWAVERTAAVACEPPLPSHAIICTANTTADVQLQSLCILMRLAERLAHDAPLNVDVAASPSSSGPALEVAQRYFRGDPILRVIQPAVALTYPHRTIVDAVNWSLGCVLSPSSEKGAECARVSRILWHSSVTALLLCSTVSPVSAVTVPDDAQRFVLILEGATSESYRDFAIGECTPEGTLVYLLCPNAVSYVAVDGEVIPSPLSNCPVLLPRGVRCVELKCGKSSVPIRLASRTAMLHEKEASHADFESLLASASMERLLPPGHFASSWHVLQHLAQLHGMSSVVLANLVWRQACAVDFNSGLLCASERAQIAHHLGTRTNVGAALSLFWQAVVSWAAQPLQRDIALVYEDGTKAAVFRPSDATGALSDAEVMQVFATACSSGGFAVARFSPSHWDLIQRKAEPSIDEWLAGVEAV